ncbi:hypothetical protein Bca52824_051969 [Brassica carinata]|uniref:Uncharacterized protein n=1 Tax=Brassica carinata TaxID=52824 RepID=A0A8X7R8Y9_BRACI|nr:hypothetical protein Bca52824_051969 [Brassica carinata]
MARRRRGESVSFAATECAEGRRRGLTDCCRIIAQETSSKPKPRCPEESSGARAKNANFRAKIAASLRVPLTHPTEERREDPTLLLEGPLADPKIVPRSGEVHASPGRGVKLPGFEPSVLNDRESDRKA